MVASKHEYYDTGDDGNVAFTDINYWACQTFTVGNVGTNEENTITKVVLKASQSFSPSGNFIVSIKAVDGDGKPTGADLSSGSIACSSFPLSSAWFDVTMSSYDLQASTQYAIVMRRDDVTTGSVNVRRDGGSATYGGGMRGYSNNGGSSWTLSSGADFVFEQWGDATGGSATFLHKVQGVANADIYKINGVLLTNISKVNGVS